MIKRALISVSDKTGIIDFAKELVSLGIEIISTGGTAKALQEAGLEVIGISEITGFPECLDGRVKTLHPNIHAGLLAIRENEKHMDTLKELNVETIDMVVVNLYPFRKTIEKENVELDEAIENIDIGGPSMLRAAAKNYKYVSVVIDPSDYINVINELKSSGMVSADTNFKLAAKVFAHTASYDALIANYLWDRAGLPEYPETVTFTYEKMQDLRYGENPHQTAAYYREMKLDKGCLASALQLHGKELSFNNINDTNGALETLKEFSEPTVVAVKHANPCGVGSADTIYEAYLKAYKADPISIFGGIIALNREVDEKTAEEINKIFVEIVVAPSYTKEALDKLMSKKNIRILQLADILNQPQKAYDLKKVGGGLLIQEADLKDFHMKDIQFITEEKPTDQEMKDLLFAWKVVKHVKSNAIVVAKDGMTLGVGPGQTNRIWAAQMSFERGQSIAGTLEGAVVASDAFFPFDDVVQEAAKAGIKAIIQPGGSMRDQDSIDACNRAGIAMIFTGMRHFKH